MYPYNLTVQNILAITFPTFSRLQNNKKALKEAIETSLFFISLVIFPILVGMSVFIVPLVDLIQKYNKWEPAIFSFVFFALSIGWGAISTPLVNTLNAIGKINSSLKLMIFWTILTWILTPLFIWWFGFNGVALSSFVIACTSFLPILMVKKTVPINAFEQVWRQLVAAIVMGVVGFITIPYWSLNFRMLFIGMASIGLVYLIILTLVGRKKIELELAKVLHRK